MTLVEWFIFFLAVQVVHFLGTWKLYQKAGRQPWEAAIPVYNAVVLMRIIGRPAWWVILLFVPVVNLIMFPVVWVETLRSFGKKSTTDTILGIVTLGFYIYYINYTQEVTHIKDRDLRATSKSGDTVSSLLFAIVVATIVHTYVLQPFTIPTASLEKTLLVGDFLFVSKVNYGARVPMTTVAAPMVHDTIPFFNVKSYSTWPQLPYLRLPGYEKVKKNDIVVFNWPIDTVRFFRDKASIGIRKPVDKKSNYVKRCVGTPGDTFSLRDGVVYINDAELKLNDRARLQTSYSVTTTDGGMIDPNFFIRELKMSRNDINSNIGYDETNRVYFFNSLTAEAAAKLKANPQVKTIEPVIYKSDATKPSTSIFPHTKPTWTVDNIGDIYIPEKGKSITLTSETLPFYKMIISEYEGNDLKVNGNEIRINGEIATTYTFRQDYYYMMGDNRHNSEDSRYWGFVPDDHIVGKPVFIWMSYDSGTKSIRWERLFTTVGGSGEPFSYLKIFIGLLAAWFIFDYFRKKRKTAE